MTPKFIKLLESTDRMKTKKYSENVLQLQINEVVSVHCNIVNNQIQRDPRVLFTFVANKSSFTYHQEFIFIQKHFIQSFHTLKHGLLIKPLCHWRKTE